MFLTILPKGLGSKYGAQPFIVYLVICRHNKDCKHTLVTERWLPRCPSA